MPREWDITVEYRLGDRREQDVEQVVHLSSLTDFAELEGYLSADDLALVDPPPSPASVLEWPEDDDNDADGLR